jgi:hypothetical protein
MLKRTLSDCNFTESFIQLTENWQYDAGKVVIPSFVILGALGRIILLWAFRINAKTEPAYLFQIFATAIQTITIIAFYTKSVVGTFFKTQLWFKQCYSCIYFSENIITTLQTMFKFLCKLL